MLADQDPAGALIPAEIRGREGEQEQEQALEVATTQLAIQRARLGALQEITTALAGVHTPEDVATAVVGVMVRALGAGLGGVRLLSADGAQLEWLPAPGYGPILLQQILSGPLSQRSPPADVVRSAGPIWIETAEEGLARYPEIAALALTRGIHASAWLPLQIEARIIGVLSFGFAHPRAFAADEREFLQTIAGLTVQALERARMHAAERAQARAVEERAARLAALQEVTAGLAVVRTPEEVAGVVMAAGSRALDAIAGLVRLLNAQGTWLEPVRAVGYRPHPAIAFDRLSPGDPTPHADVLRLGQPVWLGTREQLQARYPTTAPPLIAAGYQATATLPLRVEERIIGTLGFGFAQPRAFEAEEREFIQTIVGLTAQALERARLYVVERERARAAEEVARLRSDFLAAVSHELRTPLAAMVGYGELLESQWATLSEERRQNYLRRMLLAANRQTRLVEDLLLASLGDLGALSLRRQEVALAEVAQQAAQEVRGHYADQHIELDGPQDLAVWADPARVVQVLTGLLDNAAKHSPQGSPILLRWAREEDLAVVRVCDCGAGVPVEGRERLFTRFGRLPAGRIRAGRVGTGLGLYLGRLLAEGMRGSLDLELTGPLGSTFRLSLPVAR
jgi:signal transduction histidine kinase